MSLEFGRFLELSLDTEDIVASVSFYERLGFGQYITGDAWRHRYGAVGDGRIALGLHERPGASLAVSFVLPQLAQAQSRLLARRITPERASLGDEELHQLSLRDPGGQMVLLLEARTFSPTPLSRMSESLAGYFTHLSLPQADFNAALAFWESAGLIALPAEETPYPHLPLTSDQLSLAFHSRQTCSGAFLLFACRDLASVRKRLLELGLRSAESAVRPAGLSERDCVLIKAPEGTSLLLVQATD